MLPDFPAKAQAGLADTLPTGIKKGATLRWMGLFIIWSGAVNTYGATYTNFIENGGWSSESSLPLWRHRS